jgi:hypothetical protein
MQLHVPQTGFYFRMVLSSGPYSPSSQRIIKPISFSKDAHYSNGQSQSALNRIEGPSPDDTWQVVLH